MDNHDATNVTCGRPLRRLRGPRLEGLGSAALSLRLKRLLAVLAVCFMSDAAQATQLITEQEAKLPPPNENALADRRGILRGPKVELISPTDAVHSPLHLQLKFESFGGAKIDRESVRVIYLRTPNVDLTLRVKPYLKDDGIDIPDTELPPGEYTLRVDVKDSDGRPGSMSFTFKVSPSP